MRNDAAETLFDRFVKRGARALVQVDELACHALLARPLRLAPGARCLTICFDDAPQSAAERGAALLEQFGARATFYVCFGQVGQTGVSGVLADEATLAGVAARRHEVACHTYSHLSLATTSRAVFEDNLESNLTSARALGLTLSNFAYPYGRVSLRNKGAICRRFASARGINHGIVRNQFDRFNLPSTSLEATTDFAGVMRAIDSVGTSGGWLILYSHDVGTNPSRWGVTPNRLKEILTAAAERRIQVLTVAQALGALASQP